MDSDLHLGVGSYALSLLCLFMIIPAAIIFFIVLPTSIDRTGNIYASDVQPQGISAAEINSAAPRARFNETRLKEAVRTNYPSNASVASCAQQITLLALCLRSIAQFAPSAAPKAFGCDGMLVVRGPLPPLSSNLGPLGAALYEERISTLAGNVTVVVLWNETVRNFAGVVYISDVPLLLGWLPFESCAIPSFLSDVAEMLQALTAPIEDAANSPGYYSRVALPATWDTLSLELSTRGSVATLVVYAVLCLVVGGVVYRVLSINANIVDEFCDDIECSRGSLAGGAAGFGTSLPAWYVLHETEVFVSTSVPTAVARLASPSQQYAPANSPPRPVPTVPSQARFVTFQHHRRSSGFSGDPAYVDDDQETFTGTARPDAPKDEEDDIDVPERSTVANADEIRFSCALSKSSRAFVVFLRVPWLKMMVHEDPALCEEALDFLCTSATRMLAGQSAACYPGTSAGTLIVAFEHQHTDSVAATARNILNLVQTVLNAWSFKHPPRSGRSLNLTATMATGDNAMIVACHGMDVQTRTIFGPLLNTALMLCDLHAVEGESTTFLITENVAELFQDDNRYVALPVDVVRLPPYCGFQKPTSRRDSVIQVTCKIFELVQGAPGEGFAVPNLLSNALEQLVQKNPGDAAATLAQCLKQYPPLCEPTQGTAPQVWKKAIDHAARLLDVATRMLADARGMSEANNLMFSFPRQKQLWEQYGEVVSKKFPAETNSCPAGGPQSPRAPQPAIDEDAASTSSLTHARLDADALLKTLTGKMEERQRERELAEQRARDKAETATCQSDDTSSGFCLFQMVPVAEPETVSVEEEPLSFSDAQGNVWCRTQRTLGKGAFGQVFLGLSGSGSMVAIKGIPLKNVDAGSCLGIHKEVALLSRLRHENIVELMSACVEGNFLMIVMEAVGGGSLHYHMCQYGKLHERWVKRYLRDILAGLRYLHSNGIMHRDIKPHNVLLTSDGRCKLADFGSAGFVGQANTVKPGELAGTILYMAPEACLGLPHTHSDIWSVGILTAQLLTGQVPWHPQDAAIPHSILNRLGKDPDFGPALDEVPQSALSFVKACLTVDPNARPSADELLKHGYLSYVD